MFALTILTLLNVCLYVYVVVFMVNDLTVLTLLCTIIVHMYKRYV